MKKTVTKFFLATLLTLFVVGCSDDSEEEGITNPEPTISVGFFLDSEVKGLTYQSGDNPAGTTDENGTFEYTPGQPLTFSIGGVELGTLADGASICTPNDFIIPENIARFIQSLDADGDPSNGIDLTGAAAALANVTVSSDVFENTSSTGFENDAAIIGAIATVGTTLLDTATANANLADGTDNTFDPLELAGFAFVLIDPDGFGLGIIKFDELANPGDMGSTGFDIPQDETTVAGGTGTGEDFIWLIDANGVMTLTFDDGEAVTVNRSGGSSRSISVTVIENNSVNPITLLRPVAVTETDICGASITVDGVSTKGYFVIEDSESAQITFKSDGTFSGTDSTESFSGFWSVGNLAPNILVIINGNDSNLVPNEWTLIGILSGDLASSAELLFMHVTFTGNDSTDNSPNFIWDEFTIGTITPNSN